MYLLYSVLLTVALVLTLPYWIVQVLRTKKYRAGLAERFGMVPDRLQHEAGSTIWFHAVSVGELIAISQLITEMQQINPSTRVVISTTTDTGQRLARDRFGEQNVFYFPLDFGFAIRPYLRTLNPRMVVMAETEFWPNFLRLVADSGAKLAVINARISDRSRSGYLRFRKLVCCAIAPVNLFLTQTDEDRCRLIEIGAPSDRVCVTGNLKYDVTPPAAPAIVESLRAAFQKAGSGPVIVAGSTMAGEEPLLMRAFEIVRGSHPKAVMILAPRHPQRWDEVTALVKSLGVAGWRRSLWGGEDLSGSVLVLDTIGELAGVYSLADLAFVGGSLVEHGGHNILEAAQYGIPVLVGPHYENFRDMVNLFRAADAIRVVGPAELPLCFVDLLSNHTERENLGRRALETLRSQTGATQRTLLALQELLNRQ